MSASISSRGFATHARAAAVRRSVPATCSKSAYKTGPAAPFRIVDAASFCTSKPSRAQSVVSRATSSPSSLSPPKAVVKIDNMTDSFATIISVEFGDRMGEMLSTISALKNIGLNIRRAKLAQNTTVNRFFITESLTSEKIVKSYRLEEIRLTVLSSLKDDYPDVPGTSLTSRPSSSEIKALGRRDVVPTTVEVSEMPNGSCSLLKIVTSDRPGLLVDIVHILKDINLNVVSAEIDTIGDQAVDIFFVTYRGEPLTNNMITLTTNSLLYYLSLSEIATEESY